MRVNDLQIGDWIYYSKESQYPMQVVAIFEDGDLYLDFKGNEGDVWECKADEVEPIPISAEILEKNGFVKDYCYYDLYEEDGGYLQYYPHEWRLDRWYKDDILFRCQCYYVHQLQQAFKLCGIDKEIKL